MLDDMCCLCVRCCCVGLFVCVHVLTCVYVYDVFACLCNCFVCVCSFNVLVRFVCE